MKSSPLKLGVYVCHCGQNVGGVLDVDRLSEQARSYPEVVLSKTHPFLCSEEGQTLIQNDIKENGLDRVVVAACTPKLHEKTFKKALEKAELNPHCLEIANIREQCAWVHMKEPEKATAKAGSLIAASLARASTIEPLEIEESDVTKAAMVIGGGVAGIQAALDIADNGFKVYLVEKEPSIGGKMAQLDKTFPTLDCSACILTPKMVDAARHPNIELVTYADVKEVKGSVGNFTVKVLKKPRYIDVDKCIGCGQCAEACRMAGRVPNEFDENLGKRGAAYIPFPQAVPLKFVIDPNSCLLITKGVCGKTLKCADACKPEAVDFDQKPEEVHIDVGAIVVATGYDLYDAKLKENLGYGELEGVINGMDFERLICANGPLEGDFSINGKKPTTAAFISCVGSREKDGNHHCSRFCCMYSAKQAHMIKERVGDGNVAVYYTDMRAFGKDFEEFFTRVKTEGIDYRRRELDAELKIEKKGEGLVVKADGYPDFDADLVVLSVGATPVEGTGFLSNAMRIERSPDGFFRESHPVLSPADSMGSGIFLAGCAQGPKDIPDSVAQASAAAAKVSEILCMEKIESDPPTANVIRSKCAACLTCSRVCPYNAIDTSGVTFAQVIPTQCEGCGICTASCPGEAIVLPNFEDMNVETTLEKLLASNPTPSGEQQIIAFCCDHGAYEAADLCGTMRLDLPVQFKILRLPCSGKVEVQHLLKAVELGADGVMVIGCKDGNCQYRNGSERAGNRVAAAKELLKEIGVDENRLEMFNISSSLADEFREIVVNMTERARTLGPTFQKREVSA
jgi:heterodisulfide reductase subunit A